MRAAARSVLLLILLHTVAAFQTRDNPEPPKRRVRVPAGHDSEAYCKACLYVSNEIRDRLVPQLHALAAKLEEMPASQTYRRSSYVGSIDEMVEHQVERACGTAYVNTSPKIKRSCEYILEEHGEALITEIIKWHKAGRAESQLRAMICTRVARACKSSDLSLVPHSPDLVNTNKTEYVSERPPAVNDGPVFKAVAETLNGTLNNNTKKDLVLYFTKLDERGDRLEPMVTRHVEPPCGTAICDRHVEPPCNRHL